MGVCGVIENVSRPVDAGPPWQNLSTVCFMPCSVDDGSGISSSYPCICGDAVCPMHTACQADSNLCFEFGCTNATATNYHPKAIKDDGSCYGDCAGNWSIVDDCS